jgi:hypothetical protein
LNSELEAGIGGSGYCVIFRSCHTLTLEILKESYETPVKSADLEAEM